MRRSITSYGLLAELVSLLLFRPLCRVQDRLSDVTFWENEYDYGMHSGLRPALAHVGYELCKLVVTPLARWLCRQEDRQLASWGYREMPWRRGGCLLPYSSLSSSDDIPF